MKEKLTRQSIGFAQIKNEVLCDKDLSLKAKGLFAYLYSKPDDWDFSSKRISEDSLDCDKAVRAGLQELEKSGYLTRKRLSSGKVEYFITYEQNSKKPNGKNRLLGLNMPNGRIARRTNRPADKSTAISNKEILTNKEKKQTTENFSEKISQSSLPSIPSPPLAETPPELYETLPWWSDAEIKKLTRGITSVIGKKDFSVYGQLILALLWDFNYAHIVHLKRRYPGRPISKADQWLKNIVLYAKECGETQETFRRLLDSFFTSEKAGVVTINLKTAFSADSYDRWKQGKLVPKKKHYEWWEKVRPSN